MKKITALFLSLSIVLTLFCITGYAYDSKVPVVIPDYDVIIDDSSIYYADSVYPLINYKGITYFPLTYEYSRAMNLTTGWLEGSAFMVAYNPSDANLPIYETTSNTKNDYAVIPSGYNIYLNAKKVNNESLEYPFLNFRGVTYFPITWEWATEEFGWQISFENRVLKIDTENYSAKQWDLLEKRENDAVFSRVYYIDIPLGDGWSTSQQIKEYVSVDYKTGNVTELSGYIAPEEQIYSNSKVDITVKNGESFYKEQKLDGIYIDMAADDYVKPDDVENYSYTVNAWTVEVHSPLDVVEVNIRTYNQGKESNWGNDATYTYIRCNDRMIYLGKYTSVRNVYSLGKDLYFNTVDYGQTIFKHFKINKKLWKLSSEGILSEISYADYNSMEIIGKSGDKLYLKCIWSPEDYLEEYGYSSVSLVNDGYYTFDGEGIKFISPYIYSNFDVVSENGDILAVNNRLGKITVCDINPEYY